MPASARSPRRGVDGGTRSAGRARRQKEIRNCYRATALSTVLPGVGLFRVNRVLASLIVLVFLVPLGYLGYRFARDGALGSILQIGVDRGELLVVLGIVGMLAAVWVLGIIATAWWTRPRHATGSERGILTLFTALMCLVVLAPAALVVNGIDIQRETIQAVVTDTERKPTTVEGPDPWKSRPRVNLLLLGSDHEPDREGVRPDSIMVASIDTASGDAVFFGLPRNLQRVPFPASNPFSEIYPQGFDCGSECLLNAVWTLAEDRPDLFPFDDNPGLTTTRDVVSEVTGLSIDDTVLINLRGFQQLVDAMGGVTINATERVPIGGKVVGGEVVGINGWIEPGVQHMDGYHALWYARSRATTDDFSRMRRQRCVVGALVDQVDPLRMLARYPQLAETVADNVRVDIPAGDLGAWAELVLRMKDGRLQSLPVTNQVVNVADPDFELIRSLVQDALRPKVAAPTDTATPTRTPDERGTEGSTDGAIDAPTDSGSPTPADILTDLSATC